MSGEIAGGQPDSGIDTWDIERVEAFAAGLAQGSRSLETVRVLALSHVYPSGEDPLARLRWARLALSANRRAYGSSAWDRNRMLSQDFMLRTWLIEHLGADDADADRNPEVLAADTLAALTLDPGQADAASMGWRVFPPEEIAKLRRHKNLTLHLGTLIGYLQPGPARDQLSAWLRVRGRLP